jgi:hypothetical protein
MAADIAACVGSQPKALAASFKPAPAIAPTAVPAGPNKLPNIGAAALIAFTILPHDVAIFFYLLSYRLL